MNKDELIEKLEETKVRLSHYQQEENTEYIDLCREEICEIEESIAELEMNKEIIMNLKVGHNTYELNEIQIKELIRTLQKDKEESQSQLDTANKKLEEIKEYVTKKEFTIYGYKDKKGETFKNYTINSENILSIIGGE